MRAAGLDIGSRSVGLVVIDRAGAILASAVRETTPHVGDECARLLREHDYDALTVTGYGRALA
ncbi:MAG: 3-hydroxyacyl-ACP dehydratase, partial [Candidatus Eisenbacteria bacterium]|nr:3-hydroxyacyl-ACP dehydratase [Candidatus Eisenbacteria bacterium]